jgi:hypothetical protein
LDDGLLAAVWVVFGGGVLVLVFELLLAPPHPEATRATTEKVAAKTSPE